MSGTDYALSHKVDELGTMVAGVSELVGNVSIQVAQVEQKAGETDVRLQGLADRFDRFAEESRFQWRKQQAVTEVGNLRAQAEHDFGHHKLVRRSAVGLLQGFDLGLVSEDVVRGIGEELMIQTPRYWLAPVLVALGAWAGDDPDLCDQAVREAFRRSPGRTSLFMALVLRRQGRRESSLRWLRHYLAAQDPTALSRDFAVILECVAHGAFGPAGLELVRHRLDAWRDLLLDDEAKQQAQVDRWRVEVESQLGPSRQDRFPRLAAVSPQWPALDRALANAGVHQGLLTKYTALAAEESETHDRLEDAVDDILDRLVNEYDDDELPLRRRLTLMEAIVDLNGDEAAAQQRVGADDGARETTLDYLTLQTASALNPAAIGVSRSTQRIAVAACHEWFTRAHGTFTRDYRLALPQKVEAVFEQSHSFGATVFRLPRWTGAFTEPMDRLERSLAEHWAATARPYIDSFTFDWRAKAVLPVVTVVGAVVLLAACLGWAGPLIALAGGGVWALVLRGRAEAARRRQEEARDFIDRATQDSIIQLRGAGAELADWAEAFRLADTQETAVRTLIQDLATTGNAPAPFEARVVGLGPSYGGRHGDR